MPESDYDAMSPPRGDGQAHPSPRPALDAVEGDSLIVDHCLTSLVMACELPHLSCPHASHRGRRQAGTSGRSREFPGATDEPGGEMQQGGA
jgi:hypothetical protein